MSFAEIPLVKIVRAEKIKWKYLWICIFQTFSHFFGYLGVFAQNAPLIKKMHFARGFFETNLDLRKHPQQVFWIFSLFFKHMCSIFVFICVFGELRELCAKILNFWTNIHREIICQSWPLLTPFYSGPTVHWTSSLAVQYFFPSKAVVPITL